jgi:hypothetical protein
VEVCIHQIKLPASVCLRVLLASQQLGSASLRVGAVRQSLKTSAFFIFLLISYQLSRTLETVEQLISATMLKLVELQKASRLLLCRLPDDGPSKTTMILSIILLRTIKQRNGQELELHAREIIFKLRR